jgi:hypothetical protein
MDNLFYISINKIVFFIIITYILYICKFINTSITDFIVIIIISIVYICKCQKE